MKNRIFRSFGVLLAAMVFAVLAAHPAFGQKTKPQKAPPPKLPEVKQIDAAGLKAVMTPNGRPLLVNFWATWCDPCREEFPDLVKIDADYSARGLDFIVISMDDLQDLKTTVPRFLAGVKAKMPAFLLIAKDEGAFLESITSVESKDDAVVGLPVTVLFDATGKIAYKKSGKIKPEVLRAEIDKLLPSVAVPASPSNSR